MPDFSLFNIKQFEGRFRLLLILVIATLPFGNALNSILIGLLFLNTFSAPKGNWSLKNWANPLSLSILIFWAINLISLFYSNDMEAGLKGMETKTSLLLLPLALGVGQLAFQPSFNRFARNTFVFIVALAALYCLAYSTYMYLETGSAYRYWSNGFVKDHRFFYTGLSEPIMHPGYFSVYIGVSIFMIWKGYLESGKKHKMLFLLIAFMVIFMMMLQGRMNIIAFVLITLTYIIISLIQAKRYLFLGISLAGLILTTYGLFSILPDKAKSRFTEFTELSYDITWDKVYYFSGLTVRLAEWECAKEVIIESPIIGHGIGDAKTKLLESYERKGFKVGIEYGYNCHNQYLESWVVNGLLGVFALLGILWAFLRRAIRNHDVILAMVILFVFLSMATESMLERHWAVTLLGSFILFLGLSSTKKATP